MTSAHDLYLTPIDKPDALCAKCERANLDNPRTILDEPCEAHVTTDWEICVSCCLALPDDGYASCDECEHIARRYAASKMAPGPQPTTSTGPGAEPFEAAS